MENKPIKRNKYLLQLSKDHHFSLLFCWKIREGLKQQVGAERMKKYVLHFWQNGLEPHFREEEKILFAPAKDDKVQRAMEEHKQIKKQVDTVLSSPGGEAAKSLALLADAVDAHVRYEERVLFPHLEEILSDAELKAVGKQLQHETVFEDNYADEFWKKDN